MKKQPNKQIEGVQTDIMDIPTLTKYNSTKHSSTRAKLVDAHKDENRVEVNFTLKQTHFRKHPELNVRTRYNIYIYIRKKLGITFQEKRQSVCTTEKIDRGMTVEKNNWLEELKAAYTT